MRRINILYFIIFGLLSINSFVCCRQEANERIGQDNAILFHGIPRPESFISDHDSILTVVQYDSLNRECRRLKEEINVSLVNLIVKKVGVDNFKKEFADSLFNVWGIGDSITNRGILIALSIDDRRIAIVTGLGLETDCPDSICLEIIQDMIPYCQEGQYFNALAEGTNDIKKVLINRSRQGLNN